MYCDRPPAGCKTARHVDDAQTRSRLSVGERQQKWCFNGRLGIAFSAAKILLTVLVVVFEHTQSCHCCGTTLNHEFALAEIVTEVDRIQSVAVCSGVTPINDDSVPVSLLVAWQTFGVSAWPVSHAVGVATQWALLRRLCSSRRPVWTSTDPLWRDRSTNLHGLGLTHELFAW